MPVLGVSLAECAAISDAGGTGQGGLDELYDIADPCLDTGGEVESPGCRRGVETFDGPGNVTGMDEIATLTAGAENLDRPIP